MQKFRYTQVLSTYLPGLLGSEQLIDELSLLGSLTVGGVGLLDATEVGLGSLFGVICDAYGGVGLLVVVVLDVGLSFFRDFPFSVYHIPMLFSNI